jgi:hypothetical protein
MHSATHYRERAVHLRRLAGTTADLALQEQLETVATDYDQIAGELDARHRPPQPET